MGESHSTGQHTRGVSGVHGAHHDKVYEATYSQCLPAKVFREMNAADFGYAFECSPARTLAKAFNPKMMLLNPKNLMRGDNVFIERYVLEA